MPERSEGGAAEIEVSEVILGLEWAGRGHGDLDPADADPDLGADLEQLEPNGARGGVGGIEVEDECSAPPSPASAAPMTKVMR